MKKIAVITYHASHNFGSVLQAYALQTFIKKLLEEAGEEYVYIILNYRTETQKSIYSVLPKPDSPKNAVKFLLRLPYYTKFKTKAALFEDFIRNNLNTGSELRDRAELEKAASGYDYYISGGDQIWNVRSRDFDDAYYLYFAGNGKRVSYAASFGPLDIDWNKYDAGKYGVLLKKYDSISVREEAGAGNVKALSGIAPQVHIDPTLLLGADDWKKISSGMNYNDGKYILFYCLEPSKTQIDTARRIGKLSGLPVVCTRYNGKADYLNPFVKLYGTGPKDFISLAGNASFVITSSFHGTAFSLLFKKPFCVFNGMRDNRISALLKNTGTQNRSIADNEVVFDDTPPSAEAERYFERERGRSGDYLKKALEIQDNKEVAG